MGRDWVGKPASRRLSRVAVGLWVLLLGGDARTEIQNASALDKLERSVGSVIADLDSYLGRTARSVVSGIARLAHPAKLLPAPGFGIGVAAASAEDGGRTDPALAERGGVSEPRAPREKGGGEGRKPAISRNSRRSPQRSTRQAPPPPAPAYEDEPVVNDTFD